MKGRDDVANVDMDKLKFGAELTYVPLAWLALSGRVDRVNPNSHDPEQGFTAVSPRVVFRTSVFSNEQVVVGYTRYFLGGNVAAPPEPGAHGPQLDANLFYLAATMWW